MQNQAGGEMDAVDAAVPSRLLLAKCSIRLVSSRVESDVDVCLSIHGRAYMITSSTKRFPP